MLLQRCCVVAWLSRTSSWAGERAATTPGPRTSSAGAGMPAPPGSPLCGARGMQTDRLGRFTWRGAPLGIHTFNCLEWLPHPWPFFSHPNVCPRGSQS